MRIARLIAFVVFLSTAFQLPSFAHDGEHDHEHEPPKKAEARVIYRPTRVPDRITLTWTDDPATTQAVTWRTSSEVTIAYAELAVAEAGPGFVNKSTRVTATSQPLETAIATSHFHTVEFRDLKPSTKYAYRVGDTVNWSEWFHFTTASDAAEPFSFVYFGDAQNDIKSLWSRVLREAYSDQPKTRFFLHAGDLINQANSDPEWGDWCAAGKWVNGMIPSIAVPGNHEMARQAIGPRVLSQLWRPHFAFPENGPEGLEETCYTLVYQGTRIIAMNSNEQHDVQAVWLDNVLKKNECEWVVCTFHHPVFSTGRGRDNSELRDAWKPILDKHKVDLVLQGHDHTYGRSGLDTPTVEVVANVPTGLNQVDEKTGTVYVVSVSGPKMYPLNRKPFMVRAAEDTQLYQIIHIDGEELRYEARTAIGDVYDAFTLVKQPGSINKLIERVPDTPERLRGDSEETAAGSRRGGVGRRGGPAVRDPFANDKNKDGKLSGDEIPSRLRRNLTTIDTDKDGAISSDEYKAMRQQFGGRRGQRAPARPGRPGAE